MKIVYWGKGLRGAVCLKKVLEASYEIVAIVGHPTTSDCPVAAIANESNIPLLTPEDPNAAEFHKELHNLNADLFILGGYGKILRKSTLEIPKLLSVNLHGGKLPESRGSSPLNWALIHDRSSFGLSIIRVEPGIDTGDILSEREFPIGERDTIADLHEIANREFPEMLIEVLEKITSEGESVSGRKQSDSDAGYYPRRFPEDGLIDWERLSAREVYNRIRALTDPYPCAFSIWNGKRILLKEASLPEIPAYGEAGRIYRKTKQGILVCANDQSLWIHRATYEDGSDCIADMKRYDCFLTTRELLISSIRTPQERS